MCLLDDCRLVSKRQQLCCVPYVSSSGRQDKHSIFRIIVFRRLKASPICSNCVPSLTPQMAVRLYPAHLSSCTATSCQANLLMIFFFLSFFFYEHLFLHVVLCGFFFCLVGFFLGGGFCLFVFFLLSLFHMTHFIPLLLLSVFSCIIPDEPFR